MLLMTTIINIASKEKLEYICGFDNVLILFDIKI